MQEVAPAAHLDLPDLVHDAGQLVHLLQEGTELLHRQRGCWYPEVTRGDTGMSLLG